MHALVKSASRIPSTATGRVRVFRSLFKCSKKYGDMEKMGWYEVSVVAAPSAARYYGVDERAALGFGLTGAYPIPCGESASRLNRRVQLVGNARARALATGTLNSGPGRN
jgi:hypothetical protein